MKGTFDTTAAPKPAPGELVAAADRNDLEAVKDLLRRNADIDEKDGHENTALLIAIGICNGEMACLLIDSGANPDIKDRHGNTALMNTAYYGYHAWALRTAQKLLDKGASLDEKNMGGDTVFTLVRFIIEMHVVRAQGERALAFLEMLNAETSVRKAVAAEKTRKDMVGEKQDTLRKHAPKFTVKP